MSSSKEKSAMDVLDNAYTVLDKSKGLLDLAPVPGLSAAADVVLAIIDQVKKMKANKETVAAISMKIEQLKCLIVNVVQSVEIRAESRGVEKTGLWNNVQETDGWKNRVNQIQAELQGLLEKAQTRAKGSALKRFFGSTRDEETLKAVSADLTDMLQRYQTAGTLSIEAMTEDALTTLEKLAAAQKAEALKQAEERQNRIIDAIPHADNAGFRSVSNAGKASYLYGTRDAVWRRINEWVSGDKPICFLIGAAGMGKSTIASEFCRRYETQLGASFFFSRNDANVGSTEKFFTTLAYQLAHCSWEELRPHIVRAAELHSRSGPSQQMKYAVEDLLHQPLVDAEHATSPHSVVYVVVDALDECTESSTQPNLIPECLRLLVSCALRHPSTFRLLLTSRPVPDYVEKARLDSELKDRSVLLSLYDIEEREAIDQDICELIRTRLCASQAGKQWYQSDSAVVGRLMEQSQGVFVYACTAVDFIAGGTGLGEMKDRLDLLLTPHNQFGLDHLDELYRIVLETAFPTKGLYPKKHEQVRLILAWVALGQWSIGIAPEAIEKITEIPCAESIPILLRLGSVLVSDDEEGPDINYRSFRAMHVTFRDFLIDRVRCGDQFYVDPGLMHARLASGFMMRFNMPIHYSNKLDEHHYFEYSWEEHIRKAAPTEAFIGIFKTMFTSLSTSHPSLFCTLCLKKTPSLYTLMDRQVVDRDIIGPAIHSSLSATASGGAQCYERDPTIVTRLTEKAEGMWLYVYTALRFICAGANTSEIEHRIQLVLAPRQTYDLSNLSLLYRTVLECEFPPRNLASVTREHLQHLLAWITLSRSSPPSLPTLAALSGIPNDVSTSILTKLRPVLQLHPDTDGAHNQICSVHRTFNEFLKEKAHSGDDFHVDPDRMHALLAVALLRALHNHLYKPSIRGDAVYYPQWQWAFHAVQSKSSEDLTNLLKEIYSSISTSQPSYFFSYYDMFSALVGEKEDMLQWVDNHIGRELAETIGEQYLLRNPELLITYGERVRVEEHILADLEGSAKEEVAVRLGRFEAQMNRLEQCWNEMQPGIEVVRWWDQELKMHRQDLNRFH